jgi:drug/metabolite transporter (DMT)-like permease
MTKSRASGVLLALLSAASFSSLGLFAKLIYTEGFSVPQALAWRFSVAALFLWSITILRGSWRATLTQYRDALMLGFAGFAPQAGMYFMAVRYLDPGLASLLLYLYPSFVVIFGALFLRVMPRKAQVLAVLLSLIGCTMTLWTRGSYPLVGYFWGISVAILYAVYLVVSEKVVSRLDPLFATTNLMSAAAFVYWIITLASGSLRMPASVATALGILGIGILATVVPILTLFAAIRRIGAADTSLVSTVEPLFTIILSALLLGERLTALQLAGGAVILCAVLVLNLKTEAPVASEARIAG